MNKSTFTEQVAAVLQKSLAGYGVAVGADGNVVLSISRNDYDYHFGQLYLQVLQVIEKHFPARREDIKLLFRTDDGTRQHIFRLWHSNRHVTNQQ